MPLSESLVLYLHKPPTHTFLSISQDAVLHSLVLDKLDSTYLPVLDQLVAEKAGSTRNRLLDGFRDVVVPIVLLAEPLRVSD